MWVKNRNTPFYKQNLKESNKQEKKNKNKEKIKEGLLNKKKLRNQFRSDLMNNKIREST